MMIINIAAPAGVGKSKLAAELEAKFKNEGKTVRFIEEATFASLQQLKTAEPTDVIIMTQTSV